MEDEGWVEWCHHGGYSAFVSSHRASRLYPLKSSSFGRNHRNTSSGYVQPHAHTHAYLVKEINTRGEKGGADDGVVKYPSSPFPPLCLVVKARSTPPQLFHSEGENVRDTPMFSVNILGLLSANASQGKDGADHGPPPSLLVLMGKEADPLHPVRG